ncbi:MAG: peptidoglycan DD-metalloendopeptidase family protein [Thermoleophilaceae bacterium]|jgi:peptidoglycan hydrolase-like protein with peptidoglycan-binding domain|nr:peptidoglycan DD-metalloendopeptidase family protein [Thermoleophilaceae bacterium]
MTTAYRLPARLALALLVLAVMLAGAGQASAALGDRALREGMEGRDVQALQRKLTRLGIETTVDGYYGTGTKRSMKRYERRNERKINGRCSRSDGRHVKRQVRALRESGDGDEPPAPGSGDYTYGSRVLYSGNRGGDVAQLQRLLTRQGLDTPATGVYDARTKSNVKRWEAWRYQRANGKVDRNQAKRIRELANEGARYVKRAHVFPVRGPHDYGGAGSRFGAPRSDHTHQGQDVSAAQGTKLVAVHDGKVAFREYQAGGAGYYLVIHGRDGSDSVYMHMAKPGLVKPGAVVRAGEKIGRVGSTGSSSGPHLHFELWTPHWFDGGAAYDPLSKLKAWDRQT